MTTAPRADDLLPIALDMTASLTAQDRSKRLVEAVVRALPCDAAVLLRLDGNELVPVAAHGLSPDVMGRRFARSEHPRLDILCRQKGPTFFPAASPLPDPYDGLVVGAPHLDVHACLGCPLVIEGELVGALTVDALEPGSFDSVDERFLVHLAALAAAALRTSDLMEALEQRARHEGLVAKDLMKDLRERRGGLLIGESEALRGLKRELELVAASDFPVLVTGETGVGKELVVRTLQAQSPRSERPLVYVNCAALPESIVESELFGHEKGSFTGAEETRLGKFRVADGASLLLDEIGELPLHMQPKLLRVLQEGEIQPIGADHAVHVDVRVLAATNRDLEAEVRAGRFRADLLHRLDVCRIRVPALREHKSDIPLLTGHFADHTRRRLGTGPVRFGPDAQAELASRSWPGNVRELENVVSRAILHASGRVEQGEPVFVQAADLSESFRPERELPATEEASADVAGLSLREAVQDFQRNRIQAALKAAKGNRAQAARSLGMHRSNLHHLARRLGLR